MKTNRMTFTSLIAVVLLLLAACSQAPKPQSEETTPEETTLSAQALVWQLQTVDGDLLVGEYTSLALDGSGNPVISYYDDVDFDLKLVHCGNTTCTSGNTIVSVDSAGNVGTYTSIELDSSGNPVISYRDNTNANLKLVHCGNATCTSGNTIQTVDSVGNVGWYTSIELDSSGNPVISYWDNTNGDLKLVHCGNATCTSGNTFQTVDSAGSVGLDTSIELDSSGNPVISYHDFTNGDLKLVHCGNATCSSGNTIQTVDSAGNVGTYTSLALDSSGNPVISYQDFTNGDLKLVHCGNATCSSGNTIQTVDSAGNVGTYTSLALDSSGNPVISYQDFTNGDLKLAHCGNATCSSGNTIQTVDSAGVVGTYTSLALDSSDNPVISYNDRTNVSGTRKHLKLARLVDVDTTPPSVTLNQASGQADPTNASPILFTATFSELVFGDIRPDEIILSGTAGATTAVVSNTSDPYTYTITVTGMTTSGTVIASMPANVVTDASGNGNTASTSTDNTVTYTIPVVDSTPPVITPNVVGTLGNNDWYTSDVSVSWTVTDSESAISNQTGCDAATVSADTTGVTFTCSATSAGGTNSKSVTIKRDTTAPTVTISATKADTTPYSAGTWTNQNVHILFICSDATSGVATCPGDQVISPDGSFTPSGTATDNAGNSASVSFGPVQIDKTAPAISAAATTNPNAAGWYTSDVTVHFTCTDALSGVTSCPSDDVLSSEGNAVGSSTPTITDAAGNTSAASNVVTVKIDKTAPSISFVNRTPANSAGWNNSDVTLEWTCSDATSGAVSANVSQTVSSEGANQSSTGTCLDNAGNASSDTQSGINIDKTAPILNPVVSPNPVLLNASATVVSNASDSLSGLDSQSCGSPDTSSVGSKSVSCSATDNAGNSASASASANYQVVYAFSSFLSPVDNLPTLNQVKAGQAIPVKFSLSGNQGLNILASGSPSSQGIACDSSSTVDDIEITVTAGSSSLSYDSSTDTYTYVWKTNKAWANTCRQLIVTLVDGTQHLANFKFK